MTDSEVRLEIAGDVVGHVVIGDHNIVVSEGGSLTTLIQSGELPVAVRRERIALLPRRTGSMRGRDADLNAVAGLLSEDPLVQVHGPPGIGKTTLVRRLAHRLSGSPVTPGGLAFLPAGGRSADDLVQDIFEACYEAPGYRPTRQELQRLMSGVEVCLLLDDLEISNEERTLLLDAVPDTRVLFTSPERSLWQEGRSIGLRGLAERPALELLAQVLDRPLDPGELTVAQELIGLTGGSPLLLVQAAADAHGADRLHPGAIGDLVTRMVGGVSDAGRELATLLAYADTAGIAAGVVPHLVPDADTAETGLAELTGLGLALETEDGFRLAPGVADALPDDLRPGGTDAGPLAIRLRDWAGVPDLPAVQIAAHATLITAVIDAAVAGGRPDLGARLARKTAPLVATSLRVGAWEQILARGKAAAEQAGDRSILAYLTHEDGIRSLVTGHRAAAAVAIAAAVELWHLLGDTSHHALAQHTQALTGQATSHASTTGSAAAHPAHAAHTAHATGHTAHATGHTAHSVAAKTGATAAKTGMTVTAKISIGVAVVAVSGTGAAVGATVLPSHPSHKRPVVVAAPPMIAYATPTAVEVRTGTGPAKTLGPVHTKAGGTPLAWSGDGTQLAWLTDGSLYLAQVKTGQTRKWPCPDCGKPAFLGTRVVTTTQTDFGGAFRRPVTRLHAFGGAGTSPALIPVTGIHGTGSGSDFYLLGRLSTNAVVVAAGDAGGSDMGGPQLLYRVGPDGAATQIGRGSLSYTNSPQQISGGLGDFAADGTGNRIALTEYTRGGACGGIQTALVVDAATGTVTSPKTPGTGGGPDGFLTKGLWFDGAGTAYASFVANPSTCTPGPAPSQAAQTIPIVCKYVDGQWQKVAQGTLDAAYSGNGWLAERKGTLTDAFNGSFPLTISHGLTSTTIPQVSGFAWSR